MSTNTIKVIAAVSKEISRRFDVKADLINSTNRQYDKPHAAWGANSGSSIEIKLPQKLIATESATMDIQDGVETTTTLNVNKDIHVALGFTAEAMTQDLLNPDNMKMFGDDFLDSAVDNIIAKSSANFHQFIRTNTYNSVGAPGTGPTSLQVVSDARKVLNNFRAPRGKRSFILDPDNAGLLNQAQIGLFHPGDSIAQNYKDGSLSASQGFQFLESPDLGSHTNGAGASYVVDGVDQTGSSLLIKDGTGIVTAGTTFTLPGVYMVDPVSGTAKAGLQQFTVLVDKVSGDGAISISPPITIAADDAYKTVSASPADAVAFTIVGSASTAYGNGVAWHEDAYVFGSVELADIGVKYEVPVITGGAGDGYSRQGAGGKGVHMKLYMDGDITNRRSVARLDMRYGYGTLVNEWSTTVQGI